MSRGFHLHKMKFLQDGVMCDDGEWTRTVGRSCQNDSEYDSEGTSGSRSALGIRDEFVTLGFMSTTRQ